MRSARLSRTGLQWRYYAKNRLDAGLAGQLPFRVGTTRVVAGGNTGENRHGKRMGSHSREGLPISFVSGPGNKVAGQAAD
jgi:hypothetical protein